MTDSLSQSIADLRRDYSAEELTRETLASNPIQQFEKWFQEAIASDIREANAMSLCTIGEEGTPTVRTVLMKDFDESGVTFFTNYESRKAREMERTSGVALLFFWKELERQVQVKGTVQKVSKEISEAYFNSRPYDARIGAWASRQSEEIPDRDWLVRRVAEFEEKYPDNGTPDCVPLPPFWGGYCVTPSSVEFWQGRPGRKHDRFDYRANGETWTIVRLSP